MEFNHSVKLLLLISLFTFSLNSYATASPSAIVCEQSYALCTSAPCIPDPKTPGKSLCTCSVEQGQSAGFTTCDKRKPYLDKYNVTRLISTFSFAQFSSKKSLDCPQGAPWSNCVDMPCTVDPQNANRAICQCELSTTPAFFTFGGNCESASCKTGFWSGATKGEASDALRHALEKVISNPAAPTMCSTPGN